MSYPNKPIYGGYGMSNSNVMSSSVSNYVTEYGKCQSQEDKWSVLMKIVGKNPTESDINTAIELISTDPPDNPFRLEILENLIKYVKQGTGWKYINADALANKHIKKGNFDLSAVICRNIESELNQNRVMMTMVSELRLLNGKELLQKLYLEEIQIFLEAKKGNNEQEISHFQARVPGIKNAIFQLFYGGLWKGGDNFKFDLTLFVFARYLLALNPLTEGWEYKLVSDIIDVLVRACGKSYTDDSNQRDLLEVCLDYLRIRYFPKDDFKGYRNLLRVLDLIDQGDLQRVINRNFPELISLIPEKKDLTQIMLNMVSSNLMNGPLQVILCLSENYAHNRAFEYLIHIHQHVITPIIAQKIRVSRCFDLTLEISKFFFYGFAGLKQSLNSKVVEDLVANLDYMQVSSIKNYDEKRNMGEYLKFLDVLMILYDLSPQDAIWIDSLKTKMNKIRRELSIQPLYDWEMSSLLEKIKPHIWEVTLEDIGPNTGMKYFTETLVLQYRTSNKITGMGNIGNTCYLAATIQSLFAAKEFREAMINLVDKTTLTGPRDPRKISGLVEETAIMFFNLRDKTESFMPYEFKAVLPEPFRSSKIEQDANEFYTSFMDKCEEEMKAAKINSIINGYFGGQMRYYFTCKDCNKPQYQDEGFMNLYLNFEENQSNEDQVEMIKGLCSTTKYINEIDCDFCKKKSSEMSRRVSILKLPPYLVMTLSRFKFIANERQKIFNQVEIYEKIDFGVLFPDQKELKDFSYTLYAIIVHIGQTTDTGHYYTLIRDEKNDRLWYSLNDSLCYVIDNLTRITEIFKSHTVDTPYMLFYKRNGKK